MIDAIVLQRVERQLAKIAAWYDEQGDGLGDRFLGDYRTTLLSIRERPTSFAIHDGPVRRAKCGRFPHNIFFQLARRDVVKILSVYHPSRDPKRWRST